MKKIIVFIMIFCILLMFSPLQVYADRLKHSNSADELNAVSLIAPGNGLASAKGDGTDETAAIQAIFDYAVKNHKGILIPEGYTFTANNLAIHNAANFTIYGYGTLKNTKQAQSALLTIKNCHDFVIETINTDGNVAENYSHEGKVNQYIISTKIVNCRDFTIKSLKDKNPAGDSLYLRGVENAKIGTIEARADEPSGRNALSIIKAQNVTIDKVISENVGYKGMPSGIDFEPNYADDHIQNVVIKSAIVRTATGNGVAITNKPGAIVKDIKIDAVITKYNDPDSSVFKLNNVENFQGNIKCYQEGNTPGIGASITGCKNIDVNLEIYNAAHGIELGKGSSNINLTGKIIGTSKDGIAMWDGISSSTIDMEIKKVAKAGKYGAIRLTGKGDNLVFKGDYSYSGSGEYCFKIDGQMTNCKINNLKTSGWNSKNKVLGKNASALRAFV